MPEYSRRNCRCSEASWRKISTNSAFCSFTPSPAPQQLQHVAMLRVFDTQVSLDRHGFQKEHRTWPPILRVQGTGIRPAPDTHKNAGLIALAVLQKNKSAHSCRKCSRTCPCTQPAPGSWERM